MKVLVTGAAGFIGFHLSQSLLQKKYTVVGIDNLNKSYAPIHKKARLSLLQKNPQFHFYKVDILKPLQLESIFRRFKFDVVYHLAGRTGVRASIRFPLLYKRVNILGTKYVYLLAHQYQIKQFIFASSSSVYGNSQVPFQEKNTLPSPTSPYAFSKQEAEKFLKKMSSDHIPVVTVFRFFSVYGPYGRPDMAPFLFTDAISHNKTLNLFGTGQEARDYTYIDDIVNGLLIVLDKTHVYEVLNLGNDKPITIATLIRTIESLTHKKARINKFPNRNEEVLMTWADISKSQQVLQWKPTTSFHKGMKRFIDWYNQLPTSNV